MQTILIQILCSLVSSVACLCLFHTYKNQYSFTKSTAFLLSGLTLVLGFFFGYLQPSFGSLPTYLETLALGPLLFLCATDLKAMELPDYVNLLIGVLGLIYLIVAPFSIISGLASATILFLGFFLVALISGGALGGGDIKYALAFGLWIPTHLILPFLLFSTLSASVYGVIVLMISKKKEPLPFGPFLVLSSIYLLFLF